MQQHTYARSPLRAYTEAEIEESLKQHREMYARGKSTQKLENDKMIFLKTHTKVSVKISIGINIYYNSRQNDLQNLYFMA